MKSCFYFSRLTSVLVLAIGLAACGDHSLLAKDDTPVLGEKNIRNLIPSRVQNRLSWAKDIQQIMDELKIERSKQNVCTIIAVVDQESNFVANPQVPNLGRTAVEEVNNRLEEKFSDKLGERLGIPVAKYFQDVLKTQPSKENSYLSQMKKVKTEKDLDVLYRQIFDYMTKHYHVSAFTDAARLVGQDIAEKMNPINTLGSMQVHIHYAKAHERNNLNINDLRDDLYTQNGGLYYGIHRLMQYDAKYSKQIYRFADYNSGMYSSRNAAVQQALAKLTETKLDLDGDLLLYNKNEDVQSAKSQSEIAINKLFAQNGVVITAKQVRSDLKKEKEADFENTQTYLALKSQYLEKTGKKLAYAIMPQVVISGPKLSREYNTNWYASRVNTRYESCMRRAK